MSVEYAESPLSYETVLLRKCGCRNVGSMVIMADDCFLMDMLVRFLKNGLPTSVMISLGIDNLIYSSLHTSYATVLDDISDRADVTIRIIVAFDQIGVRRDQRRNGARLMEIVRRDYRLKMPFLLLSLDSQEILSQSYSIIGTDVPGSYYLKMPFHLAELESLLRELKAIPNDVVLNQVILKHCHYEARLCELLHDCRNALHADDFTKALEVWNCTKRTTAGLAIEQIRESIDEIDNLFSKPLQDNRAMILQRLQCLDAMFGGKSITYAQAGVVHNSLQHSKEPAPKDFQHLLIVDDDGYDVRCVAALRENGYGPIYVAKSVNQAIEYVEADPPDVLLCDLRLEGKAEYGMEIASMSLSSPDIGLTIIMSADTIPNEAILPDARVLEGEDKFNVEKIHALICEASKVQEQAS